MQLRQYQQEASSSSIEALQAGANPVVALPTGSGKSLVIADLCSRLSAKGGKIVVLAHVQELLGQNSKEYEKYSGGKPYGVYSAGLNRFEHDKPVVFAGIQSVYSKAGLFADADLIIVDEAHTVPPTGEGVMYTRFFNEVGCRRMGVTATPWRLDGGSIYGEGKPFDALAYSKNPLELVEEGWLAPLSGVSTSWQLDLTGVSKTGGDYSQSAVQDKMDDDKWLEHSVDHASKIIKEQKRKHVVVFLPTIATATRAAELFNKRGITCGTVSSEADDRDEQLVAWKGGEIRAITNVDILTTGFNFPALDCIVCLRPTQSSALWVQMLGRGMRLAEGKKDCLVLDYVGNLQRLGGVSTMEAWAKEGKDGKLQRQTGAAPAGKKRVLGGNIVLTTLDPMLESKNGLRVDVQKVMYTTRPSKKPGKDHLMAVYDCQTDQGVSISVTQFVCVEYDGGARYHAEQWFKRRGGFAPYKARQALVDAYSLPTPKTLRVHKSEGYINVLSEQF